MENVVTSKTKQ